MRRETIRNSHNDSLNGIESPPMELPTDFVNKHIHVFALTHSNEKIGEHVLSYYLQVCWNYETMLTCKHTLRVVLHMKLRPF